MAGGATVLFGYEHEGVAERWIMAISQLAFASLLRFTNFESDSTSF
jgi:hypothetical protein